MLDAVRKHIAIYAFCMKGNDEAMSPLGEVGGGGRCHHLNLFGRMAHLSANNFRSPVDKSELDRK